jgi:alanyl-tRNA synthetase
VAGILTERLYLDDAERLEFEARVVALRDHEGRPAVVLDRTAFYAESGGQPWDTGTLGGASVLAVLEEGDQVLHVVDRPLTEGPVQGRVDAVRRRDHRQQHHGQHLLSRAFVLEADARTIGFHLGAEESTIDLDRPVTDAQVRAAETRANEVVWEARPVRVRRLSPEQARALGVVPPEGVEGDVRLVEAQGFDLQPCGGTHPRSTAEVGVVLVTGTERYKGGTRITFVCGHRALERVATQRTVLDRLVSLFSAPVGELPEVARKVKDDLAEGARRERGLRERALEGEARLLLDDASQGVIVAAYEGWGPADLRVLAQRLVDLAPCVALLGARGDKAHLVFAQSDGLPHDIPALLREAVERLGGRGGGRGNLAQGGGDHPELLDAVLEDAAARVRSRV